MFKDALNLIRLLEIEHGLVDNVRPDEKRGQAEIERCREEIDAALLAKYEQLKVRYGSSALAAVEEGICSGCRISLPLTAVNRLMSEIIMCDQCGRILYDPDRVFHFQY